MQNTLALVKTGVILDLLVLLSKKDDSSSELLKKANFTLAFRGGTRLSWLLRSRSGKLSIAEDRAFWPSLKLYSPEARGIGALLSQKKSLIIPIPGFWSTGKALKSFKALASRLAEFLGGEAGKNNRDLQTELLLEAAMMGVCQVGNHDEYVAPRIGRMGTGIVKVEVGGAEQLTRFIQIKDRKFNLCDTCQDEPSACLTFQDQETARAILTGNLKAMSALGDSRVKIRGRLPLIQGIFPLMDRFSYIMSIK